MARPATPVSNGCEVRERRSMQARSSRRACTASVRPSRKGGERVNRVLLFLDSRGNACEFRRQNRIYSRAREPRDGAALLYILVCLRSAFGVPREGTMPLQYTAERVSRATEPPCCRRQQPVSATDKSDRERPQASFTIIGLTDPGPFHPGPASVPVPC